MIVNKIIVRMTAIVVISVIHAGCSAPVVLNVRQSDLDAWVGVPVKALDTHSIFLTMRLERSFTDDGVEIRNYVSEANASGCVMIGYNLICNEQKRACNNIFYIHNGYVMEYKLVGSGGARCFTDTFLRPEAIW